MLPPFPFLPFTVPPPQPPPNFAGMSEAELLQMEGVERTNIEARIRCLRNIQVSLDTMVTVTVLLTCDCAGVAGRRGDGDAAVQLRGGQAQHHPCRSSSSSGFCSSCSIYSCSTIHSCIYNYSSIYSSLY